MTRGRLSVYLLVVLIISLLLSQGMVIFADNGSSMSKEANACKELGVLIGTDSSGVTAQYLSTTPDRIQAFIIFLRLKGLDAEAKNYNGSANFKDASSLGWAIKYMAYAKSNPDLGWQGMPNGTFAPNDKMSGQAFYKVMLETLGYKQDVDFTYVETLKFAEQKGLIGSVSDISKINSFTINDVAKGIYSTLNIKPLNSNKKANQRDGGQWYNNHRKCTKSRF